VGLGELHKVLCQMRAASVHLKLLKSDLEETWASLLNLFLLLNNNNFQSTQMIGMLLLLIYLHFLDNLWSCLLEKILPTEVKESIAV